MNDLCPHDDDPATCPPCRRADGRDQLPVDEHTYSAVFTAQFPGDCQSCNLPIHQGQPVCFRTTHRDGITLERKQLIHKACR